MWRDGQDGEEGDRLDHARFGGGEPAVGLLDVGIGNSCVVITVGEVPPGVREVLTSWPGRVDVVFRSTCSVVAWLE